MLLVVLNGWAIVFAAGLNASWKGFALISWVVWSGDCYGFLVGLW